MDGRPNGRSFGRGRRPNNYQSQDRHFRDGPHGPQRERYDRGRNMRGPPREDYGPPMGQPYHDPHWRQGPAAQPPGMGPYPGHAPPMNMPPAQGGPPLRPHYEPWHAQGPAQAPAMQPQYDVPGHHQMWDANGAPQPQPQPQYLPPHLQGGPGPMHDHMQGHPVPMHEHMQGAPAPMQEHMQGVPAPMHNHMQGAPAAMHEHMQGHPAPMHAHAHERGQAPPPWLQPEQSMLPPLPPSEPSEAPPPPPEDVPPPAPGAPQQQEPPPLLEQARLGGQTCGDAAKPVSLAAQQIPTAEMADIALNAPQKGGSQEAGEALSQPSPRIALSQEQASQTTPSPGPFKMELKAKATPSPLQKNVLRIVKGNPSLVAGVQRRTSNLGPKPAGQETPTSAPIQKPPGGPSVPAQLPPHLDNNGRLADLQTPPWLASGMEQAPALGPEQAAAAAAVAAPKLAAHSAADGAELHASGTALSLPPAQDRAQIAQNGLKAASTHQRERSSSPDSSSRSSSLSSDSSDSSSSASDSSSRSSESAGARGYRPYRRSPVRGPRSRNMRRDERHREQSWERPRHREYGDRGRDREWERDGYRDRGRGRSRERLREPYGDRYRADRHPRDPDRLRERPPREVDHGGVHGRRRDDYGTPERAKPLSSERVRAQSRLQSGTPEPRADHHRPRQPTQGAVEGAAPPLPPPDEPEQEYSASQKEAIFIQRMNESVKGRIAKLAEGYGVDFVGAHQEDVRGLDRLLMKRVYPEHPDFSIWDAVDDAFARLDEVTGEQGASHSASALSNLQLGPKPVPREDRKQPEDWECPLDVPWSLRAKRPPADPRPHPEPGEVPIEAPPMALALPTFAIFPESEEKKDGGDEDSVLSWSDTPRRHDATDEATSAPFAPAGGDMMQAPAAPRHELMVQEDGRDWALEQMSQAAAPGTAARASPSTRRPLFEDINGDVEEWSWIERRSNTVQLNNSDRSLLELARMARAGKHGVFPGVSVFRHRDQLWIPLTERGFAAKELEWVREEDVPDREARDAACPYTAAVSAAAGMSEQALTQWMDSFPAEGQPPPPAASHQDQGDAMMPPNLDVEGGEADSSSSEGTQQWFDSFPLREDPAAAAQARAQANAAAAEEAFSTRKDGAGAVKPHGVWGPRPPPQHGALVAGRLVLAAVGQAEGRTLVADLIQRALRKVREERQDELNARRQARQAQQAQHEEKRTPQDGSASAAKTETPAKSQQGHHKRKHEQETPSSHSRQHKDRAARQQPAVTPDPSRKVGAALDDLASVSRQQKILSAAALPEAMRFEAAAQQTAAAAADAAAERTPEKARGQPARAEAKPSARKRKVLQLDESSDDEAAARAREPEQATPVKPAKRAKSSTPGSTAKAHAARRAVPDAEGDGEADAEREQRKMREAAEKAQENSRHDAMKNAMLQAIRTLIQFDGKELSQLFLKPATGFDGYTDVIKNPICLLDIMNKHQKQQQYPLNRDGFDAITADLKLMCDNCREYNMGNQDLQESANLMWSEATKQLEVHYQKALSEIASLMSGQRAR